MVCLGNICRSPVAEGVLRHKAAQHNLPIEVDSAGTSGFHEGESPDRRSADNTRKNGIDISGQRSRPFSVADFDAFDRIFVMDESNHRNVLAMAQSSTHEAKVELLLNLAYPGSNMAVPDPYYGGTDGFQKVFDLIAEACDVLVEDYK